MRAIRCAVGEQIPSFDKASSSIRFYSYLLVCLCSADIPDIPETHLSHSVMSPKECPPAVGDAGQFEFILRKLGVRR